MSSPKCGDYYITRNQWSDRNLVIEVAEFSNCDRWSVDEALSILKSLPSAWAYGVKAVETVSEEFEAAVAQGFAARFRFIRI